MTKDLPYAKITMQDIYQLNVEQMKAIQELKEHVIYTNGKVKKSLWVGTTALSISLIIIGLLFNHMRG